MYAEAVVRATAFEHRLATVIPDPGVMNAWLAWPTSIRDLLNPRVRESPWRPTRARLGFSTPGHICVLARS